MKTGLSETAASEVRATSSPWGSGFEGQSPPHCLIHRHTQSLQYAKNNKLGNIARQATEEGTGKKYQITQTIQFVMAVKITDPAEHKREPTSGE